MEKDKKLICWYLISFIIYIVLFIFVRLYSGYFISKYGAGAGEYMFGGIGEVFFVVFIIFFNSFNIYIFINTIKNKFNDFKKHLLLLSLSEIIYLLWFLLFIPVLLEIFNVYPSSFVENFIFYTFKIVQTTGVVLIGIKLKIGELF